MLQIDEVISAIAVQRNRLMSLPVGDSMYSPETIQAWLTKLSVMRGYLLLDEENVEAFTRFVQSRLSTEPDLMVEILEQLYADLGVVGTWDVPSHRTQVCWDDFETQFLTA